MHVPPDPDQANTLTEFIAAMRLLKAWSGHPSISELTERVHKAWQAAGRPRSEWPSRATIGRCFTVGRRRVDEEVMIAVAQALIGSHGQALTAWQQALRRALGQAESSALVAVSGELPPDLSTFVGRVAVGVPKDPVLAIEGMAGMGKTCLAVRLGHQLLGREPHREVLFVNLRGFDPAGPPADPHAVLASFMRLLGLSPDRIPYSFDERVNRYREYMNGRASLLLLDNAADTDQVAPLLPHSRTCRVLITSRVSLAGLPGLRSISLEPLDRDEALTLLAQTSRDKRIRAEPAVADRVAEHLGRLPLAISIVGSHIRHHPDWTLPDYLERLIPVTLEGGVKAALALSERSLTAAAQRFFRLLSVHPGEDFDLSTAMALTGESEAGQAQRQLDDLDAAGLIKARPGQRYGFHDLVRAYARDRVSAQEAPSQVRQAKERLAAHYLHSASQAVDLVWPALAARRTKVETPPQIYLTLSGMEQGASWLDAERQNLLAVAIAGETGPQMTVQFARLLHYHWASHGHIEQARALQEAARKAAIGLDDPALHARVLYMLGETCGLMNDIAAARKYMSESAALAERANSTLLAAMAHWGIAESYRVDDDYSQALAHFSQAAELAAQSGDDLWRAHALRGVADTLVARGDLGQAQAACDEALSLYDGGPDRVGYARTLLIASDLQLTAGDSGRAGENAAEALRIFETTGDVHGEIHALVVCGSAMRRRGDLAQAEELFRRALQAAVRSDHWEAHAAAKGGLSDISLDLGDTAAARRHLDDSFEAAQRIGHRRSVTDALIRFARWHLAVGEPRAAKAKFGEARRLAEQIGYRRGADRATAGADSITN